MIDDKCDKFDGKCYICGEPTIPIKTRYSPCGQHISKQYKLSKEAMLRAKEAMLRGWAKFLDELEKLPKNRQLFHISRAAKVSVIANELEKFFSEDELAQLAKFETKTNIFKIDLEEWL